MPSAIIVARQAWSLRGRPKKPKAHPQAFLEAAGGGRFIFPLAPSVDVSSVAKRFGVADRVGREPRLRPVGGQLKVLTLEALVVRPKELGLVSVEDLLEGLRKIAREGHLVRLGNLGPSAAGWYRVTDYTERPEKREHGTNFVTRARVTISLTADPEGARKVQKEGVGDSGSSKWPKSYRAKKGDTLGKIALRFYQERRGWRQIADENKIRTPHVDERLRAGMALTIPRPEGD